MASVHGTSRFSVVIPAHDEAILIRRCLAFTADLQPGEAEVVVVANGCTDDTAVVAAGMAGVEVVELQTPGKAGALNAGDAAVTAFPRIYLDADVVTGAATLRRLVDVLDVEQARVASVTPRFQLSDRPLLVRLFFACGKRLPYLTDGMVGTGLYALNAAGRARFDQFPALTADDLFVQRCFDRDEVRVVDDATFDVETPRSWRSLLNVRTRIAFGNRQLAAAGEERFSRSTTSTTIALLKLVRDEPTLLPACVVYVATTVLSRVLARRRAASTWQRDDSSRVAAR